MGKMRVYIVLKWPFLHFLFSSTFTQMALNTKWDLHCTAQPKCKEGNAALLGNWMPAPPDATIEPHFEISPKILRFGMPIAQASLPHIWKASKKNVFWEISPQGFCEIWENER